MTKYEVLVSMGQHVVVSEWITVNAKNEDEAQEKAEAIVENPEPKSIWYNFPDYSEGVDEILIQTEEVRKIG